MTILVITTGGTIGAMPFADPTTCPPYVTMPPDGRDLVREALAHDFTDLSTRYFAAEHKDSKLIDDPYRDNLIKLIDHAEETQALVVHGTDTILQTAEYFYAKAKSGSALQGKTVIITGAMLPLANGATSDGFMNLKFSLEQLSGANLAAGIYIVLCDYHVAENKDSWAPRLYHFEPNIYEKYYDPDSRYSRLRALPPRAKPV